VAADSRDAGAVSVLAGGFATSAEIEYRAGKYEPAIAFAREALAADARLPETLRAGLVVRENAAGAMWSLAASNCALARKASLPAAERDKLLREARALLAQARAFKQELVDRKIDAREASIAIQEIDAQSQACDGRAVR